MASLLAAGAVAGAAASHAGAAAGVPGSSGLMASGPLSHVTPIGMATSTATRAGLKEAGYGGGSSGSGIPGSSMFSGSAPGGSSLNSSAPGSSMYSGSAPGSPIAGSSGLGSQSHSGAPMASSGAQSPALAAIDPCVNPNADPAARVPGVHVSWDPVVLPLLNSPIQQQHTVTQVASPVSLASASTTTQTTLMAPTSNVATSSLASEALVADPCVSANADTTTRIPGVHVSWDPVTIPVFGASPALQQQQFYQTSTAISPTMLPQQQSFSQYAVPQQQVFSQQQAFPQQQVFQQQQALPIQGERAFARPAIATAAGSGEQPAIVVRYDDAVVLPIFGAAGSSRMQFAGARPEGMMMQSQQYYGMPSTTVAAGGAAPVSGASTFSRDRDYDHGLAPSATDRIKDTLGVANTGPQVPTASAVSRDRDYNYGNPPSTTDKIKDTLGVANTGPQKQMFAGEPAALPAQSAAPLSSTTTSAAPVTVASAPVLSRDRDYDHGLPPSTTDKIKDTLGVANVGPQAPSASVLSRDRDYNYGKPPSVTDKIKDTLGVANTGPQKVTVADELPGQIPQQSAITTTSAAPYSASSSAPIGSTMASGAAPVAGASTLSRDRDYDHGLAPSTTDRIKDTLGVSNIGPQAPTASTLSRDRDYDYGRPPSLTDKIKDTLGVANTGPQKQMFATDAALPAQMSQQSAIVSGPASAPLGPASYSASSSSLSEAPVASAPVLSRDRDYNHGLPPSTTDKIKDTLGVANTGPQLPTASALSRDRDYDYGRPPSLTDKIKDTLGVANTGPQKQMIADQGVGAPLAAASIAGSSMSSAPLDANSHVSVTYENVPTSMFTAAAPITSITPTSGPINTSYSSVPVYSFTPASSTMAPLAAAAPYAAGGAAPIAGASTLSRDRDYDHGLAPSTTDRIKDTLGVSNIGPQAPTASTLSRDRDYNYGNYPSTSDRMKDSLGVANTGPQQQMYASGAALPAQSAAPLSSTTTSAAPVTVASAPVLSRDRDYDHGLPPSTTDKIKDTLGVANVGPQAPSASVLSRDRDYNYGKPPSVTDKIKDTLGVANTGPQKVTVADELPGQIPQQSAITTTTSTSYSAPSSAPIGSTMASGAAPVAGASTLSRDRDYDHGLPPSTTDRIKDTLGVSNIGPQAPTASTLSRDRDYNYGNLPSTSDRMKDSLGVANTGPQQMLATDMPAASPMATSFTASPTTTTSTAPLPVASAVADSTPNVPVASTLSRDRDYNYGRLPSTSDRMKDSLGVANTGPQQIPTKEPATASTFSRDRDYDHGLAPSTSDRIKDTLGVANVGPQAPTAATLSRDRDYDYGHAPSFTDRIKDLLGVANTGPQKQVAGAGEWDAYAVRPGEWAQHSATQPAAAVAPPNAGASTFVSSSNAPITSSLSSVPPAPPLVDAAPVSSTAIGTGFTQQQAYPSVAYQSENISTLPAAQVVHLPIGTTTTVSSATTIDPYSKSSSLGSELRREGQIL